MSEPKFTPGPWEVDAEDYDEEDGTISITGNLHCYDGDVTWYSMVRVVVILNDERYPAGLANAHLIAAGPDMYVALGQLIDDEPCEYDHHGNCQTHNLGNPCGVAIAIKAVSKARGEVK